MCIVDGSSSLQDWMIWDHHPIRRNYDVVMELGEGAFSTVVLARHKVTKKLFALKVVFLLSPDMDHDHLLISRREAEFLRTLDSPHIVKCYDVVDDGRQLVMVLEYLRGGQLYDSLLRLCASQQPYTEQAAAAIFAQMAAGIAAMHDHGIIHRDVKGENFVFVEDPHYAATNGRAPAVKLIDLGMSVVYDPKQPVVGALGSPGFVSPEVVKDQPHTPAMDIFSLGVVAFVMLVGRKPFSIQQSETLRYCDMDVKDAPGLQDPRWVALSASAKDLVMGMMAYNADHRLTARQMLQHDWVATRGGAVKKALGSSVAYGAANVASIRRLRNMAHGVVAVNRLSEAINARDARHRNAAKFASSRAALDKTKGYRNDASGRGVTRSDRRAMQASAAHAARLHDRGLTSDPSEDISVHFRANRSAHGGSAFSDSSASGSGRRGLRLRGQNSKGVDMRHGSLRQWGSSVMLSDLEMEGSYHGGLNGSRSVVSLSTLARPSPLKGLGPIWSKPSVASDGSKQECSYGGSDAATPSSRRGSFNALKDRLTINRRGNGRHQTQMGGPAPAESSGHGQGEFVKPLSGSDDMQSDGSHLTRVNRIEPLMEVRENTVWRYCDRRVGKPQPRLCNCTIRS